MRQAKQRCNQSASLRMNRFCRKCPDDTATTSKVDDRKQDAEDPVISVKMDHDPARIRKTVSTPRGRRNHTVERVHVGSSASVQVCRMHCVQVCRCVKCPITWSGIGCWRLEVGVRRCVVREVVFRRPLWEGLELSGTDSMLGLEG